METVNWLVIILGITVTAKAFQTYVTKIPNGNNVPDPCNSSTMVKALGHVNGTHGGGTNNVFGDAFKANNYVWNSTFCNGDSDFDQKTNGAELGDPNCQWVAGDSSTHGNLQTTGLTHPGRKNSLSC